MALLFDLRDRHTISRKMTEEEFEHFQSLHTTYVQAWNEAEAFIGKMAKKYLDTSECPNTINVPRGNEI